MNLTNQVCAITRLVRHRWISNYTEAEIDLMLDVNLKGTILGSPAALKAMIP